MQRELGAVAEARVRPRRRCEPAVLGCRDGGPVSEVDVEGSFGYGGRRHGGAAREGRFRHVLRVRVSVCNACIMFLAHDEARARGCVHVYAHGEAPSASKSFRRSRPS